MWHCTLDLYGFTRSLMMPDKGGRPPWIVSIPVARAIPITEIDWNKPLDTQTQCTKLDFEILSLDRDNRTAYYVLAPKRKECEIDKWRKQLKELAQEMQEYVL